MSQWILVYAWCWLQILGIAVLATALAQLTAHRKPAAGARIAAFGVAMALVAGGAAALPLPQWLRSVRFAADPSATRSLPVAATSSSNSSQPHEPPIAPAYLAADGSHLLSSLLQSLRRSQSAVNRFSTPGRIALATALAVSIIGLARVALGLAALRALVRRSCVIRDPEIDQMLIAMRQPLCLTRAPLVYETNELTSAAVCGWRRPVVLLPVDWRTWSLDELRSVLAHELAHIVRRDFLWRLVAALAVAMHWAQPLIYVLRRRLVLSQELSADELAVAVVGQRTYVETLARLALRQDSWAARGPAVELLPVFSGFLTRRIEMLRAQDGSACRTARPLWQGSAMVLIATLAVVSTALRGIAQPPDEVADGGVRVARATGTNSGLPARAAGEAATSAAMFQRPAFDLAHAPLHDRGGFLVRLGAILQQPRFAGLAAQQDQELAETWRFVFPDADPPTWSLADIDYIAGDFLLSARYAPKPNDHGHPNEIMFGATSGVVVWRRSVEEVFESLKRLPGAVLKQQGELPYVSVMVPAMGPVETCFCRLDERTLLWALGEEVLALRLDRLAGPDNSPAWRSAWQQVDGGLITVVAAETQFKSPPDAELPENSKWTRDLFAQATSIAIGIDCTDAKGTDVAVKVQLAFASREEAQRWQSEVQKMIDLGIQTTREELEDEAMPPGKPEFIRALLAILGRPGITLRESDGGWQVEVQFGGPLAVEAILRP